uniref:DUF985 domain-containing protein n=1 Tax=Candidatus Kentrum sp. DK TaxID=2126562 RepID=A0A450TAY5_9GAMM|nr:MAG: hypothetical protein BECKDK2373B_GA0170837_11303 [Candidatus Kentron sp. DK]
MTKNDWITQLRLEPHPIEGGYFRRAYQSDYRCDDVPYAKTARRLMTSIFYMLTDDSPIGYLHVNHADIMHYFHAGSPLRYLIVHPDGQLQRARLGANPAAGEQLQLLVKGGCWKTAILDAGQFSLLSEAVSPGFQYSDMALITGQELQTRFPALWPELKNYTKEPHDA